MKLFSKSLLSGLVLSSIMGLTACQNMPMGQKHDSNAVHNEDMGHGQQHAEMLTEGQILHVLSTANKGEIMQAQVAMPKLKTAQARSFAQAMIDQHTQNEAKAQALASNVGIAPQVSHTSNALQTDSNNIVIKLNEMTAPADKDYIMSQIKVHDKVLKTIDDELLPNTKNSELRNHLVQTRAAVAMHLEVAKKLNAMMQ